MEVFDKLFELLFVFLDLLLMFLFWFEFMFLELFLDLLDLLLVVCFVIFLNNWLKGCWDYKEFFDWVDWIENLFLCDIDGERLLNDNGVFFLDVFLSLLIGEWFEFGW